MRQIAILGLSMSTHDQAPWTDDSWEKWGLPWDDGYWAQCQRLFEMHPVKLLKEPKVRKYDYWERLDVIGEWNIPLYMQEDYPEWGAKAFPLDDLLQTVFKNFPRKGWEDAQVDWYNSSPAYMIALAIHEHMTGKPVRRIGLWGIDVNEDGEFAYEQPCLSFLIGFAIAKGIEVFIPEGPSALCKFHASIKLAHLKPEYHKRYGFLKE